MLTATECPTHTHAGLGLPEAMLCPMFDAPYPQDAPTLLLTVDMEGTLLTLTPAGEALLGASTDEALGTPIESWTNEGCAPGLLDDAVRLLTLGAHLRGTQRHTRGGEVHPLRWHLELHNAGKGKRRTYLRSPCTGLDPDLRSTPTPRAVAAAATLADRPLPITAPTVTALLGLTLASITGQGGYPRAAYYRRNDAFPSCLRAIRVAGSPGHLNPLLCTQVHAALTTGEAQAVGNARDTSESMFLPVRRYGLIHGVLNLDAETASFADPAHAYLLTFAQALGVALGAVDDDT